MEIIIRWFVDVGLIDVDEVVGTGANLGVLRLAIGNRAIRGASLSAAWKGLVHRHAERWTSHFRLIRCRTLKLERGLELFRFYFVLQVHSLSHGVDNDVRKSSA
jgi:hypothetical protein